jgi:hypothetical protein
VTASPAPGTADRRALAAATFLALFHAATGESAPLAAEAVAAARAAGDASSLTAGLEAQGYVALTRGDYAGAGLTLDEAVPEALAPATEELGVARSSARD